METVFEGGKSYSVFADYILAQGAGPEPSDIKIFLQESIDGISGSKLSLRGPGHPVTPSDNNVLSVAGYQYFLRIFKLEFQIRKNAFNLRLDAHPDCVGRRVCRIIEYDIHFCSAYLLDVGRQLLYRLHGFLRGVLVHRNGKHTHIFFNQCDLRSF